MICPEHNLEYAQCGAMEHKKTFETKSTKIKQYSSGMKRDTDENKPRYDLIPPELLKRLAELYARGAVKYGDNNWRKANSQEEYDRMKASAWRHFVQWSNGEEDEDHAVGAIWNIMAYEWHTKHKNDPFLDNVKSAIKQFIKEGTKHKK